MHEKTPVFDLSGYLSFDIHKIRKCWFVITDWLSGVGLEYHQASPLTGWRKRFHVHVQMEENCTIGKTTSFFVQCDMTFVPHSSIATIFTLVQLHSGLDGFCVV